MMMKPVKIRILKETYDKITSESYSSPLLRYMDNPEAFFQDNLKNFIEKNPSFAGFESLPNIIVIPTNEVIEEPAYKCQANKCENNSFEYVKEHPEDSHLVGGFMVVNGTPIEHFWIYDKTKGSYIDITPINDFPDFYVGVNLSHLTEKIVQAKNWWNIQELKGGTIYDKYFNNK